MAANPAVSKVEGENDRVRRAYEKRKAKGLAHRHSPFNKGFLQSVQERERVLLSMLARTLGTSPAGKHILDIGCGTGATLLPMLGRVVGKCSPALCSLPSLCPALRTHRMTMFQKPEDLA